MPKGTAPSQGLPPQLTEVAKQTPAQQGPTIYDEVDAWWWIVYTAVVQTMLQNGMEREVAVFKDAVVATYN